MRVPIEWLREYVDIRITIEELAERLNMLGLSPEEIDTDDASILLEVTSNRGDCLSMIGIAREVAAITGAELREPEIRVPESGEDIAESVAVEIIDTRLCPRYAARLITGVKIQPSPPWLQGRLHAAGMRPINNIVDITNYVMLELGQPLHAFDDRKLTRVDGKSKIIVRRAVRGEKIVDLPISNAEQTQFGAFHRDRTALYSCLLPGEVVRNCVDRMVTGTLDPFALLDMSHVIVDE